MDPDQTLREIRELLDDDRRAPLARDDVGALLDRIEALDRWLSRGGFLPRAWQAPRRPDQASTARR
ncbi:hypothetical protein [Actinocatenispora rupis]|uniref:Uncharacterized protein n=1 Tax=Actinocatenispora rupis TaxID=519421 RepID=A0A8J3J193_9ACTN|nr:hypothetical protein [Actinocatenispora rupis]GID10210.1 hypothetical protein Aru02nite_10990 [Actinocatenispora rupis]